MGTMSLKKIILSFIVLITNLFKPILIKVLPIELLRKIKKNLIQNTAKNYSCKRIPFDRSQYPDGINVLGGIKAEIGLGQSCRLLAYAVKHSSYDFTVYNYKMPNSVSQNNTDWDAYFSKPKYNINLIHINPHDLIIAYSMLDSRFFDKRRNIAYWLWELPEFPEKWLGCLEYVDEIWTPAEHVSESIRKITSLPVKTIPYAIMADTDEGYNRKYFKLPENKFLFLSMFDSNSTIQRKNPLGAIQAFKMAFKPEDEDVAIVIKVNNAKPEDIEAIENLLKGYKNKYLIRCTLSKVEVNSLIKCCDCFVSLHRAEGFGLPIAEAMLLGVPTIVTNWSANTDFTKADNSCLVDYKLVTLEEDYLMYEKGNTWAEPNLQHAADYMKRLKSDKTFYDQLSKNGQRYIQENFSVEKVSGIIDARVKEIYESKSAEEKLLNLTEES